MMISRREVLRRITMLGIPYLTLSFMTGIKEDDSTPQQIKGPFYPLIFPLDQDNDLTWIKDQKKLALGEKIMILGQVLTSNHQPIKDAKIEIWQACSSGRYNHEYDPNQAPIDPNFQGWGWTTTDTKGYYAFKTIKPGGYPVTNDWKRPPHIHFKISQPEGKEFITQLYFAEEKQLNQQDKILQRIPQNQQYLVITKLVKNETLNMRVGRFNIII
ncbi:protocatechuate 3,4-dioxygenase [Crocosphaera sp.]|uniref:protocatechuate 3,4-dioxygenase n=1 Tax=Crocosphaera sp. TaxID=2729996 RepID=UPI003F221B8D